MLVASDDESERCRLVEALEPLCQARELTSDVMLERLVLGGLTPDLIIASAAMRPPGGLHVLTAARASGLFVPFIVVLDRRPSHVQVITSDGQRTDAQARALTSRELVVEAKRMLDQCGW